MIENREARLSTLLLALTLGSATAAFIIAKTGRDALFFQGSGGLLQLPLVYINIGVASLPLALIFVKSMKTWGARPARVGEFPPLAAVVMAVGAPFLEPGDNTLLLAIFIFIPAIFGLLFASLWLLAADIFENTEKHEAARAFSRIGAGTLAGGMMGRLNFQRPCTLSRPKMVNLPGSGCHPGRSVLWSGTFTTAFPRILSPKTMATRNPDF